MSEWKRLLWAIGYAHGVCLVKHENGQQAALIAQQVFGPANGPYRVLKNQDQEVAAAKIVGVDIIFQEPPHHATKSSTLPVQRTRRKRDAGQRFRP